MASEQQTPPANGFGWRAWVVALGVVILLLALAARAVYLQVYQQDYLKHQGDIRSIRTQSIDAHRGMVTDRNGQALAVSTPVISLWANPQRLDSSALPFLAEALSVDLVTLQDRYRPERSFMYLKRHMQPSHAQQILDLDIKGVYAETEYKRFYPHGEVISQAIGITDIEDKGQEGIELGFDQILSGEPGAKVVLNDLYGNSVRSIEEKQAASPGKDLQLTLDVELQYIAYRALKKAVTARRASAGSAVILEVGSGDILALVNQPSVNPNDRSSMNYSGLRNRVVTDAYEPGSVLKPLTIAAAIDSGIYSRYDEIDTSPGYRRYSQRTVRDHRDYGVLTLEGIITKSSNVGASEVALALGGPKLWDYLYQFGLGQAANTGFPGETPGTLDNPPVWSQIRTANNAFGYGLTASTLQLAQAYSVFANEGLLKPVRMLKDAQFVEPQRVISADTAQDMLEILQTVTAPGGTATRAQTSFYTVAGKTGTVHRVGSDGYIEDQYRAVFAAVAPATRPKIVVVVMVDNPIGDEYYGGEVSAPVVAEIIDEGLRYLEVLPDKAIAGQQRLGITREVAFQ